MELPEKRMIHPYRLRRYSLCRWLYIMCLLPSIRIVFQSSCRTLFYTNFISIHLSKKSKQHGTPVAPPIGNGKWMRLASLKAKYRM